MALNEDWVQSLLKYEATLAPPEGNDKNISRTWIDGALVVYDLDDPPVWLRPILELQDEDGNTDHIVAGVTPMRKPREGEFGIGFEPDLVPIEHAAHAT